MVNLTIFTVNLFLLMTSSMHWAKTQTKIAEVRAYRKHEP